jgi:hypothetical protein
MDRDSLLDLLAKVERHIALGQTHLARQELLIAKLDRDGHDTTDAFILLDTLREAQELHKAGRERILRKLRPV